jgi:hypothetical protein
MSSEAILLQEAINRIEANPSDDVRLPQSGITFTFDQAVPTLLITKLSGAVEDAVDVLWLRRFLEVDKRRLRHEDKLAVIERLHKIDLTGIRQLWLLRNECAHKLKKMATWKDYEKHFANVSAFVAKFYKEPKPPLKR